MIRAIQFVDRMDHRRTAQAGSIFINAPEDADEADFWFYCPCGCGDLARITIGKQHKPAGPEPTWHWNGSFTEATLGPSVNNQNCGWHGWLKDGYWEVC